MKLAIREEATVLRTLLLLFALVGPCGAAIADDTRPPTSAEQQSAQKRQKYIDRLNEAAKKIASDQALTAQVADEALPDAPPAGMAGIQSEYQQAMRAYYAYRRSGYEHRLRVFAWQHCSSIIIFVVVQILVFLGMYFAAIQFHVGLRAKPGEPSSQAPETEVVFSLKEFRVRSPVLGVIVLTLSLAFFYLYLAYVYPIANAF